MSSEVSLPVPDPVLVSVTELTYFLYIQIKRPIPVKQVHIFADNMNFMYQLPAKLSAARQDGSIALERQTI